MAEAAALQEQVRVCRELLELEPQSRGESPGGGTALEPPGRGRGGPKGWGSEKMKKNPKSPQKYLKMQKNPKKSPKKPH